MAKKVVKPTRKEQAIISRRLKKQYPQMYEIDAPPGSITQAKKAKGVDRKAIMEMIAKKMKKIYRSK